MFSAQLRQAVEVSPRSGLAHVSSLVWRAYAAGSVTESEAQSLAELIEARKAVPAPGKPAQRRVGSRPRSPASMERRRRWASSGAMPPQLQARFTLAESAVLAVVAAEVRTKGSCSLTMGHIAALAGVCRKTVKTALREAVEHGSFAGAGAPPHGLAERQQRHHHHVAGVERMAPTPAKGGGGKSLPPTHTSKKRRRGQ